MLEMITRAKNSSLLGAAFALVAILGWGSFAYSALASHQQISTLTAERDAALAEHAKLQGVVGELAQVELKLGSARAESGKVAQSWAEARAKSGGIQQEL